MEKIKIVSVMPCDDCDGKNCSCCNKEIKELKKDIHVYKNLMVQRDIKIKELSKLLNL